MAKVNISTDFEAYYLNEDLHEGATVFDIPDQMLAEYKEIMARFEAMQDRIEIYWVQGAQEEKK